MHHLFKLLAHDVDLIIIRRSHFRGFFQRDSVLLLPRQYGIKVPALVVDVEVREGMDLSIHPEVGIHVHIAGAHEVLQQGVDAVAHVEVVERIRGHVSGELVAVVVGEVVAQVHPQGVEAVDLMEDVDFADVGLRAEAE